VFVYAALYLFLIVLPVLVVRDEQHIQHTVWAYLFVWLSAYGIFICYPTVASRPVELKGDGFGVWGLGLLYSADPPYNCFPSLHVAHSFVSAFTCLRLHRAVGLVSCGAALLVGVSTMLTKQHYILDVVAGVVLAFIAYVAFLRNVHPPKPSKARSPSHHHACDRPPRVCGLWGHGSLGVPSVGCRLTL
jgi:membrane-associated phospholipid phosphatase